MADSLKETDLYAPVKRLLEGQGYTVKGEIDGCDLVARRDDEPPVVVELKTRFGLSLVLQGVARLAMTDAVYLAFPPSSAWRKQQRDALKLCRRLGLGVLLVTPAEGAAPGSAVPTLDPAPYQPRKNTRRLGRMLREFERRKGDPATGGLTRKPVMTAYRQDALRCAAFLAERTQARPAELKSALGVDRAGAILRDNHYGWFERVERGVYALDAGGRAALTTYAEDLAALAE